MRTTLDIDRELHDTAVRTLDVSTKKEAIETALRQAITARRRRELAESLGTFDFTLTPEQLHRLREDEH